jgi:hypothetical protein
VLDFTTRKVTVLDELSLLVLLQHGGLEYLIVDYCDCRHAYRPGDHISNLRQLTPPTRARCCMACLCQMFGCSADPEHNRAFLLGAVRAGNLQIERPALRATAMDCRRCYTLPPKEVNPEWLDSLKE